MDGLYMKLHIKQASCYFIAFIFLFPVHLFGGWLDHTLSAINSSNNPGKVDAHANSGGRRIVRINDTIIVICPSWLWRTYLQIFQ